MQCGIFLTRARTGKDPASIRFIYDGATVTAGDTPSSLDMDDNDSLEVHIEQVRLPPCLLTCRWDSRPLPGRGTIERLQAKRARAHSPGFVKPMSPLLSLPRLFARVNTDVLLSMQLSSDRHRHGQTLALDASQGHATLSCKGYRFACLMMISPLFVVVVGGQQRLASCVWPSALPVGELLPLRALRPKLRQSSSASRREQSIAALRSHGKPASTER
jgi:hypothetical protein